jgi:hypothetical protein
MRGWFLFGGPASLPGWDKMAQDRTALIHRALRNLGVLPQGQSPSAEEYQSIDDLIDPMAENLRVRNIAEIDPDNIEDENFIPLGHVLAAVAAPEFGQQQDQAIWALKERAEIDLKFMFDNLNRQPPRTMRSDYPTTCRPLTHTSWTNG